ncbi:MAG: hypothetical protein QX197_12900 [Methylococcaceae bacterium]
MASIKFLTFSIIVLLCIQRNSLAQDNPSPSYQEGVLTIPRVNTPEQVGHYSNVTLTLNKEGTWELDPYFLYNN